MLVKSCDETPNAGRKKQIGLGKKRGMGSKHVSVLSNLKCTIHYDCRKAS